MRCALLHLPACLQLISLSAVRAEVELVKSKTAASSAGAAAPAVAKAEADPGSLAEAAAAGESSAHVVALLEWTQAVCAHYGVPVRSFGACFSDGSVFCLLVSRSWVVCWRHVQGGLPSASFGSTHRPGMNSP
jgi:hypothetical protein